MTATTALTVALLLFALLVIVLVIAPVVRDERERRRRMDAADEAQAGSFLADLGPIDHRRDYEASQHAGYVESLADYSTRALIPTTRKEA